MQLNDVLIAGGGLAGLTSAIHLVRQGFTVTLIEKDSYPHHKVCGEYISNEVLPYLRSIDAEPSGLAPVPITRLQFTTTHGKIFDAVLPLGGFGLSRYCFDHFLYERAMEQGCIIVNDTITDIQGTTGNFQIATQSGRSFAAKVVLGAFGKRSALDVKMHRSFIQKKSPWLAVKAHYKGKHQPEVVGLHTFDGGYCGVSKVEDDLINICYLVQFDSFKKYKNVEEHRKQILCRNPVLKKIFDEATCIFEKPLTISQVSFLPKAPVEDHILMIGDTAGLIHPFCGNGMAMAIHSAKIAGEQVTRYLNEEITGDEMEHIYRSEWNKTFGRRINTGHIIAGLLQHKTLLKLATAVMTLFPQLLPMLIKRTHGTPINVTADACKHTV